MKAGMRLRVCQGRASMTAKNGLNPMLSAITTFMAFSLMKPHFSCRLARGPDMPYSNPTNTTPPVNGLASRLILCQSVNP